jgi:hypothetical protein
MFLLYTIRMSWGMFFMIALAGLWILGIFMGLITGFSKTFKESPTNMYTPSIKVRQQEIVDDAEDKRQRMMDDIRQKIEDNKKY